MNIYDFMSNNPILTFFLFAVACQTLIYIAKFISIACRGYKPKKEKE